MFFRKPRKLRFDGRRAPHPQVGQIAAELGLEWLETRQLLTATPLAGDFGAVGDASCSDSNDWSRAALPTAGDAAGAEQNAAAGTAVGSAVSASIQPSISNVPAYELEVTVSDNWGGSSFTGAVGTAVPGEGITYTVVVTNDGSNDVEDASIVDALPATLSGATFTATQTGNASGFAASGSGSIDDTDVNLPAGSQITYVVQATVSSSAVGTLSNTATVTPPEEESDSDDAIDADVSNDSFDVSISATDSDTLTPQADLEITKTDNLGGSSATGAIGTAVPGEGITYTVTVTNDGPSDVPGASIVDSLPSTLSGATFTAAATGGASGFTKSGSGGIDDTDVELPAGSSVTYTLTANIASSATGTLSNTATVTPPEGVTNTNGEDFDDSVDLDADDNSEIEDSSSATDSDTLAPQADLEITKTDNLGGSSATGAIGTAVPGEGITYTVTVTNDGPSDVPGASIVDSLPSTLSGATFTAAATGGATGFSNSGSGNIDDTDVDLPAGSTVTYTLTANIASSATGTLSNTATVTPPDGVTNTGGEEFDDGVDLDDDDDNSEIEDSSSAADSDTLAPQVDLEITKSDNLGGSSATGAVGTAVPGEGITYTIVVTNDGPSDVPGASIVDDLPGTLSGATFTAAATGGATGFTASGSGNIDDTDVDLPAGSTVTYTLSANIASSATGTLSNTASVTPPDGVTNTNGEEFDDGVDLDADDNSEIEDSSTAADSDTLAPQADLEITKSDNFGGSSATGAVGTAVPGEGITYTIVVTNNGPSDVDGTSIVDDLPSTLSGATFTATQTGGASGFSANGSGNIDDTDVDLPAGSTVTYTLSANIASSATGTLSNTASVTPPDGVTNTNGEEFDDGVDLDADDNSEIEDSSTAADSDTLAPQADLEITKSDNFGGSSATGAIGTAVPGESITYAVTVTNDGPSDVPGASIVDDLPGTLSGATFTATQTGGASGFSNSGSGNIDDTEVDMPAGSSVTYTLTANIASSATGTLSNTASVTPPGGVTNTNGEEFDDGVDLDADDNSEIEDSSSATDSDTLVPEADLEITKTDNLGGSSATGAVGTAVPGEGITYTIVVTNDGPSDVPGASIVDDFPSTLSGATFMAAATGGASGFSANGSGNIDDTDVDLPTGSSVTYTLTANIASSATGTLSNTASVTPPGGVTNTNGEEFDDGVDLDADDNSEIDDSSSATDSDTLAPQADLEITKSDNFGGSSATDAIGTAVPGESITYTVTVTNDGPSDVSDASIVDDLPSTLSGATFTATQTGGASGFSNSGSGNIDDTDVDLPAGSSVTYTLTANIASSATGTLSNTASVTPPDGVTNTNGEEFDDGVDLDDDDNSEIDDSSSATDSDTLAPQADLEITTGDNLGGSSATGAVGTAVPGEGITYTIVVTNDGPSDVPGASIVDDLPGTLSGATFTATQTGGASGFSNSGSGNIDDTDVDLPAGSTITYTLTANIASSATGTLSNTASVTPPGGVTNTNGEEFDDGVDLDADDNSEIEDSSSATDSDTLAPQADLEITKSDNLGGSSATGAVGTAVPGEGITYTIVVTNDGPSDVPGTSIVDDLPSTLSGATFTAAATGGATGFSNSGSGNIDDTDVDLPAGSSVTYTLTANIASSATGTLSNTASVTPPGGVTNTSGEEFDDGVDLDAEDNSEIEDSSTAADSDTLVPEADLEITTGDNLGGSSATGAVGTAVPGEGITYTVTVTNNGPSDADGASIVDDLPGTLSGATFTATESGGVSGFTNTGTGNIDDTDVDLPAGSTVTYTLTASIAPSATGTLSNTATVTPPAGVTDTGSDGGFSDDAVGGDRGISANNVSTNNDSSATDSDTLVPQVDLEITKTDNLGGSSVTGAIGTAVPGQEITYTIVVGNAGPSTANRISIVDTLPSDLVGITFTSVASGNVSNFTSRGTGNIDDSDVSLPAGATITYTLQAMVEPTATGTLSNTATVTLPTGTTDSGAGDTTATDSDTIVPQADLEITKSDNLGGSSGTGAIGTAVPGQGITYTIVVSNAGPSDVAGATIDDSLSSLLDGATFTAAATGGASGFTPSGFGRIDDSGVDMPAGSTITYTVQATIAPSASGTLSNTATVTAPNGVINTNADNGSATDSDTLAPAADLEITKSDNLGGSSGTGAIGTAVPGEAITYTIVVTNAGPSDVTGATIGDSLSNLLSGATFTATATGGASGFTPSGSGSIDDTSVNLPVGSSVTYTLEAHIASSATGTLSNTATATPPAGVTDSHDRTLDAAVLDSIQSAATTSAGDSSATDTDTLTPQSDLEITKSDNLGGSSVTGTVGSGVPGQGITYTIIVTNTGPSDASGATIVDTLASTLSGATYTATATGGATGFTASGSGSIDDKSVNMPLGSTIIYTVHATIVSSATGTLSSTTTVTAAAGASGTGAGSSSATDNDKLQNPATSPPVNLGSIYFTVSALLTGNLTVTGNYAPPPTPHSGLPISQPQSFGSQILPTAPFASLPTAAVDNFMLAGGGGGDVELGPQLDLDLTKTNQGPNSLWNMLGSGRTEDWSSDELIGSLLDKLADVDELSLVSFEFGDDVVSPDMRKAQRVTAAKPVSQVGNQSSVLRGSQTGAELNVPAAAGQTNGGQGSGAIGTGDGGAGSGGGGKGGDRNGAGSPDAAIETAPADSSTQNATHSWLWWLGWSVSAGSVGTLSWVYRWRRRGRAPAHEQLVGR